MVVITLVGFVAQAAVIQWRVGALDRWRKDVDEFIGEIENVRGRAEAEHGEIFRRLDRLEESGHGTRRGGDVARGGGDGGGGGSRRVLGDSIG